MSCVRLAWYSANCTAAIFVVTEDCSESQFFKSNDKTMNYITLNQTADELIGHRIINSRGNFFLFTYSIKN